MSGLLHERARRGLMGTMLIVLVVLASLNLNRLPLVGNSEVIHARFAEAGGLRGGDSVVVSGAEIGKVREVTLEDGVVEADLALTDPDVELGDQTEARIITTTLLGRAAVELVPAGGGDLESGETIPVERTDSPYSITSALNQLTTESGQIDKEALHARLTDHLQCQDSPTFFAFGLVVPASLLVAVSDEEQAEASVTRRAVARLKDRVMGRDINERAWRAKLLLRRFHSFVLTFDATQARFPRCL